MSATSALARGRAAAEALMVDTCTIAHVTGESTDPDTGQVTPTTSEVYAGKCRVQLSSRGRAADGTTVGEAALYQVALEVQVPIAVTGVAVEDLVTIDSSAFDPDLAGRRFWVKTLAHKTHLTARRLGCEEVTGNA